MNGGSSPPEALREAARYLESRGIHGARASAEVLLRSVLGTDRAGVHARARPLSLPEAEAYRAAVRRHAEGEPLQYVTGEQAFRDLVLRARHGVFVPRPETEGLVDVALEAVGGRDAPVIVDVGTGTGAVALALKLARPDARVLATDVSPAATALAAENASALGLEVEVLHGSLLDPVPHACRERIALIVSNPPYVTEAAYASLPAEVRAEPREALVGGTAVHAALLAAADGWLEPGGWLAVEIGADQGEEVGAMFEARLEDVAVLPDLAGRDRYVRGRRREGAGSP